MSKVAIQGAATGTGVFTLASPATNTNRTLTLPDEAGTVLTTAGVPASAMPSGSVIQVVQTVKTDTFTTSTNSSTWVDITGMAVSITPSSASSKILILSTNSVGIDTSNFSYIRLVRDSTPIFIGDSASTRPRVSAVSFGANVEQLMTLTLNYLDSPATTSSVTYKIQCAKGSASGTTFYYNRSANDSDLTYYAPRQASSIIVMEIAG